jgi:hypothetical protein
MFLSHTHKKNNENFSGDGYRHWYVYMSNLIKTYTLNMCNFVYQLYLRNFFKKEKIIAGCGGSYL